MPPCECQSIAERLEQTVIELTERGIKNFCAGGAVGFDSLAANTVLKLREEYPHIKLTLILPCLSQTRGWAESDIEVY